MTSTAHQPSQTSSPPAAPTPPGPRAFATTRYELSSPPTGEHFRFATSSRSIDGLFRFVWTLAPGKRGPAEHRHPHEIETFEIVSGTLRIWIAGESKDFFPGDVVAIPAGTTHSFLNPGKVPLVANVTCDGPRLEDVFVPFAVANDEKKSMGNLLRFIATTAVGEGSVPTPGIALSIGNAVLAVIKLFGVKPFEPVFGWDTQRRTDN